MKKCVSILILLAFFAAALHAPTSLAEDPATITSCSNEANKASDAGKTIGAIGGAMAGVSAGVCACQMSGTCSGTAIANCGTIIPYALAAYAGFMSSAAASGDTAPRCDTPPNSPGVEDPTEIPPYDLGPEFKPYVSDAQIKSQYKDLCPGGKCNLGKIADNLKQIEQMLEEDKIPPATGKTKQQSMADLKKAIDGLNAAASGNGATFDANKEIKNPEAVDALFASLSMKNANGGNLAGFEGGALGRQKLKDSTLGNAVMKNGLTMIGEDGDELTIWDRATRRYMGDKDRTRGFFLARAEWMRQEAKQKMQLAQAKISELKTQAKQSKPTPRSPAATSIKIKNLKH